MLRDGGLYHEPGRNAQFFEKRGAGHLRDVRAELRNHCPRYDPPRHPILAIFNGTVTGREVGSTADIFGDIGDYDESIYQNKDYINQLVLSRDGRTLKSSTSISSARTIISRWASIWISPTWCAPGRCSAS